MSGTKEDGNDFLLVFPQKFSFLQVCKYMPDFFCLEPTSFICFFAVLVNESRVGTLGIKTDMVL